MLMNRCLFLPLFCFLFITSSVLAQVAVVDVIDTAVISHRSTFYHGWPTVARSANGILRVAYSGGRDYHICPFGRLEMITSQDGGTTWTRPRVLEDSAIDDRDAGIMETSQGTLLATMFTSFAYQIHMNAPERLLNKTFGAETPEMLQRWKDMDAVTTQEQKNTAKGYWMLRSTDGGINWSRAYRVLGYSPHGPINLLDGRLFYAASNGKQALALVSSDDGLTWERISDMDLRPGEMHAVQAANGDIVVQVRDKVVVAGRKEQNTSQIISTDGGKSWSDKRKIALGYPPHLIRLEDNTLLMTYGWRKAPYGIRGRFSSDNGESWSGEFIITDDAASWDLGYPTTVELQNGTLLTVWYEAPKDSRKAVLRQARWKLQH